ncbi:DsbA family oxidoreductase [Stutzerimonas nosocomialis]|uniref:DsbA family oxidoreductase n=1 Tax=Stutzerimonas nosocomialis TaxID=1056496 RepID=UPI0011092C3A|nr:DsbA family protein [Stutzerimonas nosocomialis]TLX58332.1 DsbA family oxidoreductase [Stutzerimonas nosocomialis]
MVTATIRIDVWSDYVCPVCYIQLPVIKQLAHELGPRASLVWHAFELRPEPVLVPDPDAEEPGDDWSREAFPMASLRQIVPRRPVGQPPSRKAFEMAAFARERGCFDTVHEALFRAYFEEGRDIGEEVVLLELAQELGLDTDALKQAIDTGLYLEDLFADRQLAETLDTSVLPVICIRPASQLLDEAICLRGSVEFETLRRAVAPILQAA